MRQHNVCFVSMITLVPMLFEGNITAPFLSYAMNNFMIYQLKHSHCKCRMFKMSLNFVSKELFNTTLYVDVGMSFLKLCVCKIELRICKIIKLEM
jgi:hypothetical protein